MLNKPSACIGIIVCLLLSSVSAQDKNWRESLKAKFNEAYVLTQVQANLSGISKPGTVLVVQKEGIRGDVASDEDITPTLVQDGQIKQEGKGNEFLRSVAGMLSKASSNKQASQLLNEARLMNLLLPLDQKLIQHTP